MTLIQLINLYEETKNSIVKKKQIFQDTNDSILFIFNKKLIIELNRIKLVTKNILKYIKRNEVLRNSLKKKLYVVESLDQQLKFHLFSKQFIFCPEVFQKKKNNFCFNRTDNKNIFEFKIKFLLKKFWVKLLSFSKIFFISKILKMAFKIKFSQSKFINKNLKKALKTIDFSKINPFSWYFLKKYIKLYYLTLLKKINYSYKVIFYFKSLFLKVCYFQKKIKRLKNNFLTNSFLNEKESKLNLLSLKRFSLNILTDFKKKTFFKRNLEFFLISKKEKNTITFFKENFSIKKFDMSFLFLIPYKMIKNKIFFSKNSLNSFLNLILFSNQFDLSLRGKNYEKKFQFFFNQIFFRITTLLVGKVLSASEIEQVNLLFYKMVNLSGVCKNKQKKYFLIFFFRFKEQMYRFVLKPKDRLTKIFSNSSNKMVERFLLKNELNSEKFLICFLCSKKIYLNQLKTILKLMGNIFTQVLFFKFVFRIFTYFKLHPEMSPTNTFFSLSGDFEFLLNKKLGIRVSKKFHMFFRKIVNKKLNHYLNDQFNLINFLGKIEKFQDKFLFFIFLVFQRYYFKFIISKKGIENYKIYEKRSELNINFGSFNFLRNILLDFCFGEILKKKKLILNYMESGTESLLVIGPNRDLFKFNKMFYEKNFKLWCSKIFDLNHFSRISKVFILKQFLIHQQKKTQPVESIKNLNLFNFSILRTKDSKLIKLFILSQYKQKNGFFFDESIYKHLLSKKICQNFESFYECLVYFTKSSINFFKNLSKKPTSKAKIRKLNFNYFHDHSLGQKSDNLKDILLTKEVRDHLKTFEISKNFNDKTLIFLLDNIIMILTKNKFDENLFRSICFIVMFHSYLINSKDVWNFQDSSIKVLNIFEKSIKKKFLIFKQDTSFVIKNCQVNFFNLCLLNKLKCIFKREKGFFKNSGKQGIVKNNFSQETLIHDFSEYFSLNSKHSLKKFIKNDFY